MVGSHPVWPQDYFGPKHTSAQCTFQPEKYFGSKNTLPWCLLWPGNTSVQYTLAQQPNFHLPICHSCCMLHNSRFKNVPWLKMLIYKGWINDVNWQARKKYCWKHILWNDEKIYLILSSMIFSSTNVCSKEKNTKGSSGLLLRLVSFSVEQMLYW